jgi:hypothetical protein
MRTSPRSWGRSAAVVTLLLCARPALAQDASVLFVALAPPIFLTPLVLAIGRWQWLRRGARPQVQLLPLFAVSCLEVLLWLVLTGSVATLMTGDSGIWALVPLLVAVGINWMLSRVWLGASLSAARLLYFLSPVLVLVLLAAATWVVLVNYG